MEMCRAKQPSPFTQSHVEGRSVGGRSEPGGSTSYLVSHFPWGESPQNAWLLKHTRPLKHRTAESHQKQTGYPRGDKTRLDMNEGSGCSSVSGTLGGLGDKRRETVAGWSIRSRGWSRIHPCCDGVRVLMATALSTRHVIKQYCPVCGYIILAWLALCILGLSILRFNQL